MTGNLHALALTLDESAPDRKIAALMQKERAKIEEALRTVGEYVLGDDEGRIYVTALFLSFLVLAYAVVPRILFRRIFNFFVPLRRFLWSRTEEITASLVTTLSYQLDHAPAGVAGPGVAGGAQVQIE